MLNLTLKEIVNAIKGEIIFSEVEPVIRSVSTDSRNIEENCIFFALRGENFNGNKFAFDSAQRGASVCIIDEVMFNIEDVPKSTSFIKVSNTKQALMDLAMYYRTKLALKVVGITGSNGKTSTKDMLAATLSRKYKVFKTIGNFNNEIGLPLMIFKLDNSYDIAVLEMGMSNFGEIDNLARISRPEIALITNIGISHIENLGTRENILKAKLEITNYLENNNVLIVNSDDDLLYKFESEKFEVIKTGLFNNNYLVIDDLKILEESTEFSISLNGEKEYFQLPVPGKHNVDNFLLCVATCSKLGVSLKDMKLGLENLEKTSMRLDIIKKSGFTIINDCYNSSPASMRAALEVQGNFNGTRKIAVLGTMKELGDKSYEAHKEVGYYAKENGIDLILACGEYSEGFKEGADPIETIIFTTKEELINYIKSNIQSGDIVLVKASRSMKFEQIVNELKEM